MGNDGGTIFGRKDKIKTKKKDSKNINLHMKKNIARYCALSKNSLERPVVVCKKGNILNKEEILKKLLNKSKSDKFDHIKKLSDIKEIKEDCFFKNQEFKIKCCLSKKSFTGISPFLIIWKCGCVFSLNFFKNLFPKIEGENNCPNCSKSFKRKHIIHFKLLKDNKINNDKKIKKSKYIEENLQAKKINIEISLIENNKNPDNSIYSNYESLFHTKKKNKSDCDLYLKNCRNGIR